MFFQILFLLFYLSIVPLVAHGEDRIGSVIYEANNLKLAEHPTWLKLLHYEQTLIGQSSAVVSDSFFLSPNGKTDPQKELESTLESFLLPSGDSQTICQFPARFLWLSSQLSFPQKGISDQECPLFNEWRKDNEITSISLLFATGFLGNPASYYGHTLLKLNKKGETQSELLDLTSNYGAIVPDNEDPISYIVKGIFGVYDGGFSQIEFYFHEQNYGELELRDIWEYELNLPQKDVEFIVAHLWELLDKKYKYYFFKENCAFRVAEVLELSDQLQLLPELYWTYPQTTISNLADNTINGESAIAQIIYHPSRQTRLYQKYDSLTSQQKFLLEEASKDVSYLSTDQFNQQPISSKYAVLEGLQDYFKFIEVNDNDDFENSESIYNQILSARFKLPPNQPQTYKAQDQTSPHLDRDPGYMQYSWVYNQDRGSGVSFYFRPAYYDSLDSTASQVKFSSLSMLSAKVNYLDKHLYLKEFDFVAIESVNNAHTGLLGDDGRAWKVRLGAEQQNLSCNSCLVLKAQADIGMSRKIGYESNVGIYVGAAIQNNRHSYGAFYPKASFFTNITLNPKLKIKVLYEKRHHFDSSHDEETAIQLESRYQISHNFDSRLRAENNKATELSLSFGYYW